MSAGADMSSWSSGIASLTRGRTLDFSGLAPSGGRHGSCVSSVIMFGGSRHRDGWLRVAFLAAFLFLAWGSGAASPAVGGGHAGGHVGGFAGGSHPGGGSPRGREFGSGRFEGRRFPHERGGPRVFVFPYFYDPYYPYYPYAAYCDPYSPVYTPQYCYWDDGP